jgi:hypothetical protein
MAMVLASPELAPFVMSFSDVTLGRKLGSGSFGVVYAAFFRDQFVACKMLSAEATSDVKEFVWEVQCLSLTFNRRNCFFSLACESCRQKSWPASPLIAMS